MWTVFKVFFKLVTILFLLYAFVAMRHVGSLLLDQGWNLHLVYWKVKS